MLLPQFSRRVTHGSERGAQSCWFHAQTGESWLDSSNLIPNGKGKKPWKRGWDSNTPLFWPYNGIPLLSWLLLYLFYKIVSENNALLQKRVTLTRGIHFIYLLSYYLHVLTWLLVCVAYKVFFSFHLSSQSVSQPASQPSIHPSIHPLIHSFFLSLFFSLYLSLFLSFCLVVQPFITDLLIDYLSDWLTHPLTYLTFIQSNVIVFPYMTGIHQITLNWVQTTQSI